MSAAPGRQCPPVRLADDGTEVYSAFYQHPGCTGWVVRWFVRGNPHPFRTQTEALQALAYQHERRGQP